MEAQCPVQATFSALGGRWKMLVLWYLRRQTLRFGELRRSIPEISERMLARTLQELAEDGWLKREAFGEVPPRVEYSLTDRGRSVVPIIDELVSWSLRNPPVSASE